jgi:hypothetical protein
LSTWGTARMSFFPVGDRNSALPRLLTPPLEVRHGRLEQLGAELGRQLAGDRQGLHRQGDERQERLGGLLLGLRLGGLLRHVLHHRVEVDATDRVQLELALELELQLAFEFALQLELSLVLEEPATGPEDAPGRVQRDLAQRGRGQATRGQLLQTGEELLGLLIVLLQLVGLQLAEASLVARALEFQLQLVQLVALALELQLQLIQLVALALELQLQVVRQLKLMRVHWTSPS